MLEKFRKKYIASASFYKYVISLALPMIIQNLITNFVSMLDNIMVGQIGTNQMNGVSIVNQFMFVFNITIFGGISGASIFGTQFFGKGDHEGQKNSFRFRLIMVTVLTLIGMFVFKVFDEELISLFISPDDLQEAKDQTLLFGKIYLNYMIWTLIPFGLGQAYASVVRECGETKIPMYGSMAAIGVNVILDYGLIFGNFGMPKLGVAGAAIATLIAKWVEALVVIIWAHAHPDKNKYIIGLFKNFKIPSDLIKDIIKKGTPLLFNEFLWSLGMSIVAQCYSVRGLDVVAARNISSVINNLFSVIFIQLGHCVGIIIGIKLGAGHFKDAKESVNKLIFFAISVTTVIGLSMIPLAKIFPELYNTEDTVKSLATFFIIVNAIAMPMWSYTNVCYFTLRSGGKTGITFLFDFVFSWAVMIPLAFILTRYTTMEIHLLIVVVTFSELLKVVVGHFMVKSEIWIQNIV